MGSVLRKRKDNQYRKDEANPGQNYLTLWITSERPFDKVTDSPDGWVLREYNRQNPTSEMIVQDVVKLHLEGRHDFPLWHAATVNCLGALLGCTWFRYEYHMAWTNPPSGIKGKMEHDIEAAASWWLTEIGNTWDLNQDVLRYGGYNVTAAEQGGSAALMEKQTAKSNLTQYVTACRKVLAEDNMTM